MAHCWLGDGSLGAVVTGCEVFSSAVETKGVLCAGSLVIFKATAFTSLLSLVWADVSLVSQLVTCVTDYRSGVIAGDRVDLHVISDPFWRCFAVEREQDRCSSFTDGARGLISWVRHENSLSRFWSASSEGGVCR